MACSKEKELLNENTAGNVQVTPIQATSTNVSLIKTDDGLPAAITSSPSVCGLVAPSGVTYSNGMLCFTNSKAFNDIYAYLDCQVENYAGYDAYLSLFNGDDYKIDSLLDAKGIDEDQPLLDYEKKFSGYMSLRKKLDADEETFLSKGGEPGSSSDPDISATEDYVFNTLLNSNGCFKIGDTIVKIFPNGVSYLVTNGSLTTLSQITDYYATHVFTAPNVIVLWNDNNTASATSIGCSTTYLNRPTSENPRFVYSYNGKSYMYTITVKVTNVPFFHAYTALSKNYVWKKNRWKKSKIHLYANVQQDYKTCIRVDGCNVRVPGSGYIYRKHIRAIYKSNIFHIFNNGTSTNGNTLYIAGEVGNLRAYDGYKNGSFTDNRKITLQ